MRSLDDLSALIPRQLERGLASGDLQPTETDRHEVYEGGIPFSVRVIRGLDRKKRSLREQEVSGIDPFLPPYSEDLFVADASDTHVVLLNKFPVVTDHILVVTREYESQQSALNEADFEALSACMDRIGGVGFYNAGPMAGASQPHKHLQWIPLPAGELATDDLLRSPDRGFACAFDAVTPTTKLADLYRELLAELRMSAEDPYNLLLTRSAMFAIPRSQPSHAGIPVNAMGYSGSFLVRSTDDLERLREVGLRQVLAQSGWVISNARPS